MESTDHRPRRPSPRVAFWRIPSQLFSAHSPLSELAAAAKTGVLSRLVRADLPIPVDPNNGTGTESVESIVLPVS